MWNWKIAASPRPRIHASSLARRQKAAVAWLCLCVSGEHTQSWAGGRGTYHPKCPPRHHTNTRAAIHDGNEQIPFLRDFDFPPPSLALMSGRSRLRNFPLSYCRFSNKIISIINWECFIIAFILSASFCCKMRNWLLKTLLMRIFHQLCSASIPEQWINEKGKVIGFTLMGSWMQKLPK